MKTVLIKITDLKTGEIFEKNSIRSNRGKDFKFCMICLEIINFDDRIWCCDYCRAENHLKCMQVWIKSRKNNENPQEWSCPNCRKNYKGIIDISYCYCKKVSEPEKSEAMNSPHCCGNICGRFCETTHGTHCKHPCDSLCHSGFCPPCNKDISFSCFCGKDNITSLCSKFRSLSSSEKSCQQICSKTLNCGIHFCESLCHEGNCHPCQIISSNINCHCGARTKILLCGAEKNDYSFSCQEYCGKILKCNLHKCQSICHPGLCIPCINDVDIIQTCFCGGKKLGDIGITRLNCMSPIPSCGNICGKTFACFDKKDSDSIFHTCSQICHPPPCPECVKNSLTQCQCKKTIVSTPCNNLSNKNSLKCTKKCKKWLNCRKHKCENVCCISNSHECSLICKNMAPCNLHKCNKPCHQNECSKCTYVYDQRVYCLCKSSFFDPPYICFRTLECQNDCPIKCSEGHTDHHPCHRFDIPCPPCKFIVSKKCINNHSFVKVSCSISSVFCTHPCWKTLDCGHKCLRFCHFGECINEKNRCEQKCLKIRNKCGHRCAFPCQGPHTCSEKPCYQIVLIRCVCNYRTYNVTCDDFFWFYSSIEHSSCYFTDKLNESTKLCVPCDHECRMKKRLFQIANAFGIDPSTDPDLERKNLSLTRNDLMIILKKELEIEIKNLKL